MRSFFVLVLSLILVTGLLSKTLFGKDIVIEESTPIKTKAIGLSIGSEIKVNPLDKNLPIQQKSQKIFSTQILLLESELLVLKSLVDTLKISNEKGFNEDQVKEILEKQNEIKDLVRDYLKSANEFNAIFSDDN